ncbi:MAG: hypothetical protein F4Y03_14925 [Alphaproteobacteria bacterium]|nr:hypothetical protein [Alphaproteobacteria bacterium]
MLRWLMGKRERGADSLVARIEVGDRVPARQPLAVPASLRAACEAVRAGCGADLLAMDRDQLDAFLYPFEKRARLGRADGETCKTAYSVRKWRNIERLADSRRYLRFVAVADRNTSAEHLAWHGTLLPIDHPWWQTHFPPLPCCARSDEPYGCRCDVMQLADHDLEKFGYRVSAGPPGEDIEAILRATVAEAAAAVIESADIIADCFHPDDRDGAVAALEAANGIAGGGEILDAGGWGLAGDALRVLQTADKVRR